MTQYTFAFNAGTQVATIMLPGHDMPDGSEDVGYLNISSVGPNPTDASTQHVTTMLHRKGFTDLGNLTIAVSREPAADVVDQNDQPDPEENGEKLKTAIIPTNLELAVGDSETLGEGSPSGTTFTSSDDKTVKVTKAGKVSAVQAGTATITVATEGGTSNEVVVKVSAAKPAATDSNKDTDANKAGKS